MGEAALLFKSTELTFFLTEEARSKGLTFSPPREGDAGFDIRSLQETIIPAGEQRLLETGLHLAIPVGWVGLVRDRSSMAVRRLYTHGGVIDASYRGEVRVVLSNASTEPQVVGEGDRVAQLVVVPHLTWGESVASLDALGQTSRGAAGFGSTGKN